MVKSRVRKKGMKSKHRLLIFCGLLGLLLSACFGGQGLTRGDPAPELDQRAPRLQGPAVLVFLRGFG